MTATDQISAAASQGLTRAEVIATVLAGRAMTAAEQIAFDKARGIWKLREAKRKAEKKARGPLSGSERVARHRDRAASIDAALAEARQNVNHRRRAAAEKSLAAWIKTYCVGVLLDDPPPKPHGERIVSEMDEAVMASRPYSILVARGGGKTSYTECCVAYAIATGRRRFCLISSINANQAKQILRETTAIFTSEPFATDYPDIAVPINLLDGHGRRAQRQAGHDTKVRIVTEETLLPTITLEDGSPSPASGACIRAKALKSVRGTKNGTARPDLIVLDDIQTREIAENDKRVHDTMKLIRGDVMGLAGKSKAAVISTATTIAPDDITVLLGADKVWKTTKNPAIISWPREWSKTDHGLWGEYFALFDSENAHDHKHTRRGGSLSFYRAHRSSMDAGADILNWDNFSAKDGQISGLQKLLDAYHQMGHAAFMAEYQMQPIREESVIRITAPLIASRVRRGTSPGEIPPESIFVSAATDLNPSYAVTTSIIAFDLQRTAFVTHYHVRRCKISDKLNDTLFDQSVYHELVETARELAALGIKLDAWGIDAGGKQFRTVTRFVEADVATVAGVKPTAMLGRAGAGWNPNVRSRIRDAKNDTVLCRDPERRRWMAFNADVMKESAQKAWLADVGAPGGISIFDGNADHFEFAAQIANEQLKRKTLIKGDRYAYEWKTRDPHDYGDTLAMNYALAASDGITGQGEFHRAKSAKVKVGGMPVPSAIAALPPSASHSRPKIKIGHA